MSPYLDQQRVKVQIDRFSGHDSWRLIRQKLAQHTQLLINRSLPVLRHLGLRHFRLQFVCDGGLLFVQVLDTVTCFVANVARGQALQLVLARRQVIFKFLRQTKHTFISKKE